MQWKDDAESTDASIQSDQGISNPTNFFPRQDDTQLGEISIPQIDKTSTALHQNAENGSPSDPDIDPTNYLRYEIGTIHKDYAVIRVCLAAAMGCSKATMDVYSLRDKLNMRIEETGLKDFLCSNQTEDSSDIHRFVISISGCPDACSQPQISDFGIIARAMPEYIVENCTGCGKCIAICKEHSIQLIDDEPFIDYVTCVGCAECTRVCPTKAIQSNRKGYSIRIGGGLGRHPQLAHEVAHLASSKEVLVIFDACINLYIEKGIPGESFKDAVNRIGIDEFIERISSELREYRQRFNPNKKKIYRAF